MRDTFVAAFFGWPEAADTFSVTWSDVVVAVAAVPVCVALTFVVIPVSVLNACIAIVRGGSIAALTVGVTWPYVMVTVLTGPVLVAYATSVEIKVSMLYAAVTVAI